MYVAMDLYNTSQDAELRRFGSAVLRKYSAAVALTSLGFRGDKASAQQITWQAKLPSRELGINQCLIKNSFVSGTQTNMILMVHNAVLDPNAPESHHVRHHHICK